MRDFKDQDDRAWTASVAERDGPDYKGRFYLVLRSEGEEPVALVDVRWNAARTARRTMESMSVTELRRRLRSARGRGTAAGTA